MWGKARKHQPVRVSLPAVPLLQSRYEREETRSSRACKSQRPGAGVQAQKLLLFLKCLYKELAVCIDRLHISLPRQLLSATSAAATAACHHLTLTLTRDLATFSLSPRSHTQSLLAHPLPLPVHKHTHTQPRSITKPSQHDGRQVPRPRPRRRRPLGLRSLRPRLPPLADRLPQLQGPVHLPVDLPL